ncbi:MAG: T9SS type A sorting domain-containing protein [Crocinitomicaceae bacterium]|nr:T9SS type A sorting domain-containing protein [Crocinitomicaceae bacterium]
MKHLLLYILSSLIVSFNSVAQIITIDYQLPTEQFPEIYRPGIFAVPKTANATNDLLNNGVQFNAIRTIDIETAMNYWTVSSITDVMAQLEVQKPNILLANGRCGKLILPIHKMPAWLSSSADTTTIAADITFLNAVPPANYTTWNTLMDSIVDKINNQWGLDPYYEIWNEPDGDYWQGTVPEYFEFYKNTLLAIKTNHPIAKVGGPTVSSFSADFSPASSNGYLTSAQLDSTIIGQVIDSCVSWGTPLDFISWHKFGQNLYVVDMEMDYLNQKLIGSGHGTVPFIVSEWNLGAGYRETPLDPAYMINYSHCLKEHNVDGQVVAAWQDFETGTTEFHQDYGLLSWGALHKPSWKALLLLDQSEGELLHVDSSNYRNLSTISTYANDTLKVLVSNFSLPGVVEATFSLFYEHNISADSLINNGYTPSTIDSVYQGLIVLTGSDPLSVAINSVIPIYQSYDNYFQNGRDITLKFPGVVGNHTGIRTIIDSTNNNVIYQYDSLINIGYTRNDAVNYLYPNNSFDVDNINMMDSTYSLHLQANGVALIELYIPEITVSVQELIADNSQIVVYPNPTDGIANVNIMEQDLESIDIYDLYGKHIKTVNTASFSVKNCVNGVYYLIIHSKYGTEIKKLIKH